ILHFDEGDGVEILASDPGVQLQDTSGTETGTAQAEPSERPSRGRRLALWGLATVAVLALAFLAFRLFLASRWFVGTRSGDVAVVLAVVAVGVVAPGLGQNRGRHAPEYGALFVVGYEATYLLIRYLAPTADPALFPSAALLAGIGFAVIYRLAPGQSAEQASWLAIGLCAFALTLAFVRDHRKLDGYTYTIGLVGVGLLLLPILPGLGRE